jgi:hypothetical protein
MLVLLHNHKTINSDNAMFQLVAESDADSRCLERMPQSGCTQRGQVLIIIAAYSGAKCILIVKEIANPNDNALHWKQR